MDVGRIKVIYHPVLKELRFERMENEIWHKVDGGERSRLCRYFASKDGFVLQDLGQQFFFTTYLHRWITRSMSLLISKEQRRITKISDTCLPIIIITETKRTKY